MYPLTLYHIMKLQCLLLNLQLPLCYKNGIITHAGEGCGRYIFVEVVGGSRENCLTGSCSSTFLLVCVGMSQLT